MDNIIRLLKDYDTFAKEWKTDDLELFGKWLKQKYQRPDEYLTDVEAVNSAGLDVMASYLLGSLTGFVEMWFRLTFRDLPLVSLGDFGILKTVEHFGTPSKKEIADRVIMERTTCIESIKRLVKNGILMEENDPKDRRIKRVKLSSSGKKLMETVDRKMMALGSLLVGDLDNDEKQNMIPSLNKLKDFHEKIYHQRSKDDISRAYNL